MQNMVNKAPGGIGSAVSFSSDEETAQLSGSKSTARGKKGSLQQFKSARDVSEVGKTSSRGRGRGRGRGANSLKQTTLDAAMMFRRSERSDDLFIIALCLVLFLHRTYLFHHCYVI